MMRAAVLGSPISHSLSPLIHNAAYQQLGYPGMYTAIEMADSNFADFLKSLDASEWAGLSLTMPLKESALGIVDFVDPVAARISSGNTVFFEDGKTILCSTDYLAFARIFQDVKIRKVAIIGGGGTARAALGALTGLVSGVDVLLRSRERIPKLQQAGQDLDLHFLPLNSSLSDYDLVVSTLPAGAADSLALAVHQARGTLFEVLYNPWPTQLVAKWQALNLPVIDGFTLLVEQALDQIRIMTGRDFEYTQMRQFLNGVVRSA